jgi:hypothetical protein
MKQPQKKLLYLVSSRYSGSTLLSYVLGANERISTIGERRKFYSKSIRPDPYVNQCSCGKTFRECAYWEAIRERFLERVGGEGKVIPEFTYFKFYNNSAFFHLYHRALKTALLSGMAVPGNPLFGRLGKLVQQNDLLVDTILELDDNDIFFDTSKPAEHAVYFSELSEFEVSTIWLVRDPRAQVISALKYNKWTLERACREWIGEYELSRRLLARPRCSFIKIGYEDFCRNPLSTLAGIGTFAGLGITDWDIDFRSKEQHIMGNSRMRFGNAGEISERTEWKDKVSPADKLKLESLLKDYQRYFSPSVPVG